VADLLLEARERSDPVRLEELVSRAVGDPAATVWWWVPEAGAYRDRHGTVEVAPDGTVAPGRVLKVSSEVGPIAMVVAGSRDLPMDASVLDAVTEALRLSTENRRLSDELRDIVEQVRESRARIQSAADETRKQIERDLHDGAQQLLISTGVKLNLASARVEQSGDSQLAATLAEASCELGRALSELRQLASGITPTALVHGGLRDALQELALRCPVPVSVLTTGDSDPGSARNSTAYFVVAECLANVAKHAGARAATVEVELGEVLLVTVADDGRGGADPTAGSGLRGLMDRVEASGGRFHITSGESGTRVSVSLPHLDHA
jgi:signal transduction histidine kinase